MKRILTLSLIILLLYNGATFSQPSFNSCTYNELIRGYVAIGNSLFRFVENLKNNTAPAHWDGFIQATEKGEGEKAFDNFGSDGESLKKEFTELGSRLYEQLEKITAAVKEKEGLSDADVKVVIDRELKCYYADTVENDLPKLLAVTGRLAPMEIGSGPCEIGLRNCVSTAEANYSSGLNNCASIALGTGGLFGWLGGLIGGFSCLVNVGNTYNNAVIRCWKNYSDCTGHH